MLSHSELDTEVSDAGMETTESDDCRGVSKKDGNANGVLAATRERARFSCKDGWKFIDPFMLWNAETLIIFILFSFIFLILY